MDIKQFKDKIVSALPFIVIPLIILIPPVGIAIVWSNRISLSKSSKYGLTCFASFLWVLMIVMNLSHMSIADLFKSDRNYEVIPIGSSKSDDEPYSSADTTTAFALISDTIFSNTEAADHETTISDETQEIHVTKEIEDNAIPPETTGITSGNDDVTISNGDVSSSKIPETAPNDNTQNNELMIMNCTYTVHKNEEASVTIKGAPNTEYVCKVKYQSGYSSAKGIGPMITDSEGLATWTWKIGPKTSTSFKPIITITGNDQTVKTEISIIE